LNDDNLVYQFRIELLNIEPHIWRRILVPANYTFWDLHVAIQDAMGWLDYHLHSFRVVGSEAVIGIPCEDGDDPFDTQPGWELFIRDFFKRHQPLAIYEYDFGDSWIHMVQLETFQLIEEGMAYPRCLGGARRCPPEDCGGVDGYANFLRIISDPSDPEHDSMLEWVGGSFDPEDFDPAAVRFDDPARRWKIAFAGEDD